MQSLTAAQPSPAIRHTAFLLMLTAALLLFIATANAQTYHVTDLGTLGGSYSAALGINRAGQVVGFSYNAQGSYHAFLFSDGRMRDMGTLGGANSVAYRINDSGQAMGISQTQDGDVHVFLYFGSTMSDLGPIGNSSSEMITVDQSGKVKGLAQSQRLTAHSSEGATEDLASLISADARLAPIEIRGVNDAGQAVGYGFTDGQVHAFRQVHAFLLTPVSDLSVRDIASPHWAFAGSNVIYTIILTNNSVRRAINSTLTIDLPVETTLVECNSTGGGVCEGEGERRVIKFAVIDGGASETVTLVTRVSFTVARAVIVSNSARVASGAQVYDPAPNNNSAVARLIVSEPLHEETSQLINVFPDLDLSNTTAGGANSPLQRMLDAVNAANAGNTKLACDMLDSSISELQARSAAQIPGSNVSADDQMNQLIKTAHQLKSQIGCP